MGTFSISKSQHWINLEMALSGKQLNLRLLFSNLHVVSLLRIVRLTGLLADTKTLPSVFGIEALCIGLNWICQSFPVRYLNLDSFQPWGSVRFWFWQYVWCARRKNYNCLPLLFWKRRQSWWMQVDYGFPKERPGVPIHSRLLLWTRYISNAYSWAQYSI